LYEKIGFSIIKEIKDICGQKERCYKMELKLA
jgi:ribosomal-protein-alanine N-acetyltransferase